MFGILECILLLEKRYPFKFKCPELYGASCHLSYKLEDSWTISTIPNVENPQQLQERP